jgi:hypothetical protein
MADEAAELTPEERTKFAAFLKAEKDRETAEGARKSEPKDFGEFLDKVSDAVTDKILAKLAGEGGDGDEKAPTTESWWNQPWGGKKRTA